MPTSLYTFRIQTGRRGFFFHDDLEGADRWSGYLPAVVSQVVVQYTGVNATWVIDDSFGSTLNDTANSSMMAVIAEPGNGHNSIIAHALHQKAVLTVPFMAGQFSALVSYSVTKTDWLNIFRPLSSELWGAVIVACIMFGCLFTMCESRYQKDFRFNLFGLYDGGYFALGSLVGTDSKLVINSRLSYVLNLGLAFMVVLINATYTANLASILTTNELEYGIATLADLKSSNVCMFHKKDYYNHPIQNVLVDESKLMFADTMVEAHGWCTREGSRACQAKIWEYCIDALAQGTVDAVVDTKPALNAAWVKGGCTKGIAMQPTLDVLGYDYFFYLAHPLNSEAYASINDAIITAAQDGMLAGLSTKWLETTCTPKATSDAQITFHEMRGLFYIVGAVAGLVLVMFIIKEVLIKTGKWRQLRSLVNSWQSLPINKGDEDEEDAQGMTELEEIRKLIGLLEVRETMVRNQKVSEEDHPSIEMSALAKLGPAAAKHRIYNNHNQPAPPKSQVPTPGTHEEFAIRGGVVTGLNV